MNTLVELIRRNPKYIKGALDFMGRLGLKSGPDFQSQWNRLIQKAAKNWNPKIADEDKGVSEILSECDAWLETWNLKSLLDPEDLSMESGAAWLIKIPKSVFLTKGEFIRKPVAGCYYIQIRPGAGKEAVERVVHALFTQPDMSPGRGPSETQRDIRIYDLRTGGATFRSVAATEFRDLEGAKHRVETAYSRIVKRIKNVESEIPR